MPMRWTMYFQDSAHMFISYDVIGALIPSKKEDECIDVCLNA